jgi:ISXO2-like transposase domain
LIQVTIDAIVARAAARGRQSIVRGGVCRAAGASEPRRVPGSTKSHRTAFVRSPRSQSARERWKGTRTETTRGRPYTKGGKGGPANKRPIVALVERGGNVRTFHVPVADKTSVTKIVRENISKESRLHTDESRLYHGSDSHFASHETVHHTSGEYARGDVHVNSAEGYFGLFKRVMRGIYQHCAEKYLYRWWVKVGRLFTNRRPCRINVR